MPKLKCIGGMADGELVNVHDNYHEHDQVNVPAKIEFKLSSFEEDLEDFRYGRTPKNLSIPYYPYKICLLQFKQSKDDYPKKLYYLIPYNWNEWEAILHLFRSYINYG